MTTGSPAERLDHAVDVLLAGGRPPRNATTRPLLETAATVRAALPPIPTARGFEARVLTRLTHPDGVAGAVGALEAIVRRELRHPVRILAAGAVSSAAVGVTLTAVVVWRSRRHAGAGSSAGQR
jgi:hypothetical protein